MEHFSSLLWLPTIVSAVFVFFTAALIQMLTPWHHSDYGTLPDEEAFRAAVGPLAIPPGDYTVPVPVKNMRSPEFAKKVEDGPRVMMTVFPNGMTGMGSMLLYQFIFTLFVSWFAGHVAQLAFGNSPMTHDILHVVATMSFAAYGLALWPLAIWYRRSLKTTIKANIDALIYAAITAATFVWLWPR